MGRAFFLKAKRGRILSLFMQIIPRFEGFDGGQRFIRILPLRLGSSSPNYPRAEEFDLES